MLKVYPTMQPICWCVYIFEDEKRYASPLKSNLANITFMTDLCLGNVYGIAVSTPYHECKEQTTKVCSSLDGCLFHSFYSGHYNMRNFICRYTQAEALHTSIRQSIFSTK